jgi:hypothetical protein
MYQTPAAERRHPLAQDVSPGLSGKLGPVPEGRYLFSRTHANPHHSTVLEMSADSFRAEASPPSHALPFIFAHHHRTPTKRKRQS